MKFVCDDNLGRLARWLRTLGFDTVFSQTITDSQVISAALTEDRIIITRDHQLAEKTLARQVILLQSTNPLEQLKILIETTGLVPDAARLFSICPLCNVAVEKIDKKKFVAQIPPYVYRTKDRFNRCPACGRIFWSGTHVDRMKEKLAAAGISID